MWDISGTLSAEALREFGAVFSSHPAHVDQLRAEGVAAEWLPPACAPEWFDFEKPLREIDVLVVGEEGPRRDAVAGAMAELGGVRMQVMAPRAGAGLEKILARSAVAVIVPEGDSVGWPLFAAMMAGALVLAPPGAGSDALFRDGEHLFVWNDPADAAARVKQCLSDADMRTRISESGRRHVLAGHTYEHRTERLMGALAKTPVEQPNQDLRLEVGGYYRSPRPELAVHVPLRTRRLLDVGCGAGEFGRALKHERGVQEVVGIEIVEAAWRIAQQSLDRAILGNIETMELPFPDGHFDCITCGDVLEHLVHPLEALKKLRRVLSPDGIIVASIPNARFYQVVEMLANGRWTYMDAGIMDRTHLRFFTAVEMVELFQNSDLQVRTIAPLSMMNKEAVPFSEDGYIQLQKLRLGPLTLSEYNDFLVYQYLVIAGKYSAKLLEQAERHLEAKENDHALNVARLAREKGEDEASCLRVMGKSAARLGRVNESEAYYREALLLRPNDAELRGEYGIVLFAQGRCVDARVQLDQAHAQQPHHGRILSGLGLCDLSAGDTEGAFARFRDALDADFDNEAAVEHLVGTAQSLGRLADAEPYVRRFVEFYPGNLDMGCVHAAVLMELGRMAEARDRLDNVLLFDSGHARALALMEKVREG
jgi:2-polyprenyl-3-methyl-5-hydroxy-6-metoxy-1,4-benzoquinol methylase/Tfp pilus assembly protein PilF